MFRKTVHRAVAIALASVGIYACVAGGSNAEVRANSNWYAACETDHFFWHGPDRASYQEARKDAKAHDDAKHGGRETAVVLGGT